jgi:hypothetical protein
VVNSFDHVVGLREQRRRHFEADCLGGIVIRSTWPRSWARSTLMRTIRFPGGDDHRREGRASKLLRRLLAAGLSRYEPSPFEALAKMESIDPPSVDRMTL